LAGGGLKHHPKDMELELQKGLVLDFWTLDRT